MTTVKVSTPRALRGHLTRQQVAEATGISAQTLFNFENDPSKARISTATKLAIFYGVSLDELLDKRD